MSRDSPEDLPPVLQEAIEQEANEESPDLEELWVLLESAKPPSSALPDASNTWTGVRRHVESTIESSEDDARPSKERTQRASRSRARRRFGWRWGTALAALLIAALGAWLWQRPVAVTTPPGTSMTQTLPDGSTVELNGDTRLAYSRTMSTFALFEDHQRAVRLQGEAYFDVRSAERPFVVRTRTARIEVVGTAFAVQTVKDRSQTHVALAEGTVRVQGRDTAPDRAVTLHPGQAVHVGIDGATSTPADTSVLRVTAWRRGGFAVTAQPLPAIAQALERQFGTPVRLSPTLPPKVTSSPLTLYYSQDVGVETILHDISMARGLSYRPTTEGYVLGPANDARPPSGSSE